ncbi:DUF3147 family protein [Neptuniibacter sp. CAU 1671]|uniref:DUF3147 family protein n=1 Tax=Neptuniibacter sp. CAU 1671 TaxID=3032593 RepID=UPI0023DBB059|nr:DUF3147 family protein [Neptuniibacter sp. CAU 1671]MDF2181899.1 DUF3147 family protein [Neptuniibacter sp. CAU 1671]
MAYYLFKILLTSIVIVVISEIGKRNTLLAALLASVPLISVLAMLWLYIETGDLVQVKNLASNIFWLVLPSLTLFISLPWFITRGWGFYPAMAASLAIMLVCYGLTLLLKDWISHLIN